MKLYDRFVYIFYRCRHQNCSYECSQTEFWASVYFMHFIFETFIFRIVYELIVNKYLF